MQALRVPCVVISSAAVVKTGSTVTSFVVFGFPGVVNGDMSTDVVICSDLVAVLDCAVLDFVIKAPVPLLLVYLFVCELLVRSDLVVYDVPVCKLFVDTCVTVSVEPVLCGKLLLVVGISELPVLCVIGTVGDCVAGADVDGESVAGVMSGSEYI